MRTGKRIVAGAIGLAVLPLVLGACAGETVTPEGEPASSETGPSASRPEVPEVDYVLDLNSGVMTPLPDAIIRSVTRSEFESDPEPSISMRYAASPDGSRLAYVGVGEDGRSQIFIARIDGTEIRQMTHGRVLPESPAWSPDGGRIAYAGFVADEDHRLFVLEVATGRSSTRTARNAWEPQFTPDGSAIVFSGGSALRIVPVEGGESRPLFRPEERGLHDAGMGSVSPDGSLVTFLGCESVDGPCPQRYVANVDGTDRRLLPGWMSNPAGTWSPDGSRIVSIDGDSIIVVDVATGVATPVAPVSGAGGAIWLDGHTLLIEVL